MLNVELNKNIYICTVQELISYDDDVLVLQCITN